MRYSNFRKVLADQNVSQSVYVMMCHKIGTPQQVAFRRDLIDISEFLAIEVMKKSTPKRCMLSGSVREGFQMKGSDQDDMFWTDNHRVLRDASQYKIKGIPPHECTGSLRQFGKSARIYFTLVTTKICWCKCFVSSRRDEW